MIISKSLKNLMFSILLMSMIISCKTDNPASSGGKVSTSLKITASNKSVTVAINKPSIFDLFMTRALALTPATIVDSTGASINLTSSWIVVKEVEFVATETAGSGEVDGAEVSFNGPFFVNLLSNSPVTLGTGAVSSAGFQRMKMKLEAAGGSSLPSGAPSALSSNSIYITGTVGANNFTYQSDDGTEYQIGGPSQVAPKDGGQILLEINFSNIFKQINMSGVTNNEVISSASRHTGASLCPSIDASAGDIYTCIRKGLEKHADVGEDDDGSSTLDADESKVK